jgi:hypothetical protein
MAPSESFRASSETSPVIAGEDLEEADHPKDQSLGRRQHVEWPILEHQRYEDAVLEDQRVVVLGNARHLCISRQRLHRKAPAHAPEVARRPRSNAAE